MPLDKDELSTIMSTESIYETFNSSAPTWKRHLTFHRMFIFPRHINILWMKTCLDRYIKGRSDSQMLMNFQKNSAFKPPPPALWKTMIHFFPTEICDQITVYFGKNLQHNLLDK